MRGLDPAIAARHPASRMPRPWLAAAVATVLLGIALRAARLSIFDIAYSDELTQYLEQANRLVTGAGLVPWEWRAGLRNALLPQVLAAPLALGRALDPAGLAGVWLARVAALAVCLLVLPAAWRLGALSGRAQALLALFAVAVWWESVLFSDLLLSESLGAALMLAGAALLLDPRSPAARPALAGLLAGLLIGLAVLVRLQYAVFAAILALTALRLEFARWRPFLAGAALAAALGALSDLVAGKVPFAWVWINVAMNIGDGRAARFGTSGPLAYLAMLRDHFHPVLPLVAVGAAFSGARYRPLLWAALANLAVHSLVAHKEYRFVWLTALTLLLLAGIASGHLASRLAAKRTDRPARPLGPIVAALMIGWALLSLWSAQLTGGFAAYRGGGAIPRLAARAAHDPQVCALALDYGYKSHLVPALLPRPPERPLPLLLIPAAPPGSPLPPGLAAAANALIREEPAAPPPGYRRDACDRLGPERACLYRRPGPCTAPGPWSYQSVIEANDL